MEALSLEEVLDLHAATIQAHGGSPGIRDQGALESAIEQPFMTFLGQDLYDTLAKKAAALCYSLVNNHPFIDGNKRIGLLGLDVFLLKNGFELTSTTDESEQAMLGVASGGIKREELEQWVENHIAKL